MMNGLAYIWAGAQRARRRRDWLFRRRRAEAAMIAEFRAYGL